MFIEGSPKGASLFYGNWKKKMIGTGIQNTPLFVEYAPLLEAMGISLVDIQRADRGFAVGLNIIVMTKDHEVSVGDCAKVYRLVYPRMELVLGERDLQLEVSTPGLQRAIRDVYEFTLFVGKRVRVYDVDKSEWVSGIITRCDESSVTLDEVYIGESKEKQETTAVEFSKIQKAKLDYRWEDDSHGN